MNYDNFLKWFLKTGTTAARDSARLISPAGVVFYDGCDGNGNFAKTAISHRSLNTIYLKIRQRLAEACEQASLLNGLVEMDESYFGDHRVRGRRGGGAYSKTICSLPLK